MLFLLLIILILIIGVILIIYSSTNERKIENLYPINHDFVKTHNNDYKLDDHRPYALLLSCIDYRSVDKTIQFINNKGLKNDFDQFVLTGAGLGVVNPTHYKDFDEWKKIYFQHIDIAINLHNIKEIILVEHMGCSAYHFIYGKDITVYEEYKKHVGTISKMATLIKNTYPDLKFKGYIMHLDDYAEKIIQI